MFKSLLYIEVTTSPCMQVYSNARLLSAECNTRRVYESL